VQRGVAQIAVVIVHESCLSTYSMDCAFMCHAFGRVKV
jgi:hypothetical protein